MKNGRDCVFIIHSGVSAFPESVEIAVLAGISRFRIRFEFGDRLVCRSQILAHDGTVNSHQFNPLDIMRLRHGVLDRSDTDAIPVRSLFDNGNMLFPCRIHSILHKEFHRLSAADGSTLSGENDFQHIATFGATVDFTSLAHSNGCLEVVVVQFEV